MYILVHTCITPTSSLGPKVNSAYNAKKKPTILTPTVLIMVQLIIILV